MIFLATKLALFAVISGVCGHAVVEDPPPRKVRDAAAILVSLDMLK